MKNWRFLDTDGGSGGGSGVPPVVVPVVPPGASAEQSAYRIAEATLKERAATALAETLSREKADLVKELETTKANLAEKESIFNTYTEFFTKKTEELLTSLTDEDKATLSTVISEKSDPLEKFNVTNVWVTRITKPTTTEAKGSQPGVPPAQINKPAGQQDAKPPVDSSSNFLGHVRESKTKSFTELFAEQLSTNKK